MSVRKAPLRTRGRCAWRCALVAVGILGLLLLAACTRATPTSPPPTPPPTSTPRPPTPQPSPTPPPEAPRLIICSTEPLTASPFTPSPAGDDLLALFLEPPLERVNYQWEPRLVERVPTLEQGDVITRLVTVAQGERYTVNGHILVHAETQPLQLPQLVVTYTLKSDLRWSNGEPLTSQDFIFSYHLAQSGEVYGRWRQVVERTERFVALDELHLQWVGLPGYLTTDYPGFLFPPQPAHRWQGQVLGQILQDRTPPATGPFKIVAWEAHREVRLERNPHYQGTPPRLDEISIRFPQQAVSQWAELLLAGDCDLILPDPVASTDWRAWSLLAYQDAVVIWANAAPVMLRLEMNLAPLRDGSSPLATLAVRQSLAQCIDREKLSLTLPGEALLPADGFIPPGHPAYRATRTLYDPEAAQATLHAVGWRDENGDGIREAHGVEGIANGTPLKLTLHMAPQYFVTAAHIAADLEDCGVQIQPLPTEVQLLYANDAASPLFGRTFELALFGWEAEAPHVCGAWLSSHIPTEENGWAFENVSGFTSEAYDAACQRAIEAVDVQTQWAALREAEALLNAELPTLFITWRPFWFVARPGVQGLRPDASTDGTLWNAEALYWGE